MTEAIKATIRGWAVEAGFDACGFAAASTVPGAAEALAAFVAAGRHGEMGWMEERAEQRGALDALGRHHAGHHGHGGCLAGP